MEKNGQCIFISRKLVDSSFFKMSKLQLETCKSLCFSSWLVKWYLNRLVTALINTTKRLRLGERSLIETCERSGVNRYHDWGESAPLLCSYTTAQPLLSHSGSDWLKSAKIHLMWFPGIFARICFSRFMWFPFPVIACPSYSKSVKILQA